MVDLKNVIQKSQKTKNSLRAENVKVRVVNKMSVAPCPRKHLCQYLN